MNVFLQFKNKAHFDAYRYDFQLQLRKRTAMATIATLLLIINNCVAYILNPNLGPPLSKTLFFLRVSFCVLTLAGVLLAKRFAKKIQNHIRIVNFFLDITASLVVFVVYPVAGTVTVDSFSKLGAYLWAWAGAFVLLTMNYTLGTWWMRALVATIQIIFFVVFLFQREVYHITVFCGLTYGIIFYVATIYLQERFDRLNFLEKRKIYENYEAIKKIFDDISQGIMIVDQSNEIIYANRTVSTLFHQDSKTLSLTEITSQIYVKSVSPLIPMESLSTERVLTTQENSGMHLLSEDLETIKNSLFNSSAENSPISVESYWQNPLVPSQRTHLSIKFTSSLFMDKQVYVINITDTTDRDSLIAAQASSEYKTRLLSSVSHEFRTPLNGSINFIEQALNEPSVSKILQEKWLTPALRCNRLLLSLVNDILDFSQIHAGKLRLCFETRNVAETAKECIELLEIQATKKNLKLELINNLSPLEAQLSTDHNRLRQVILNLLSNAVKFTFQGGVTLILDPVSAKNPYLMNYSSVEGVRVSCRDTGIGIRKNDQEKLFKMFEKIELENRAQINSTGAGLGLVISNSIVQRLSPKDLIGQEDDCIKFNSKENVGTTFYFEVYNREENPDYEPFSPPANHSSSVCSEAIIDIQNIQELAREIPMQSNQMKEMAVPNRDTYRIQINTERALSRLSIPSVSKISCTCPKVLIVDDDAFNLTTLDQIIDKYGVTCHWAFNGEEAIEKIKSRQCNRCCSSCQQYKLVFLDIQMPILNGFETARVLRQMIKNNEIDELRIVACTAFVQESDEKEARAAGMDAFCTKPLVASTVREKLAKFKVIPKTSVYSTQQTSGRTRGSEP